MEPTTPSLTVPMSTAAVASTGGISMSTYFLFADIIFLLIGVILLMTSQGKCATDANSSECGNYRKGGIAVTVIAGVFFFVILFFKFR